MKILLTVGVVLGFQEAFKTFEIIYRVPFVSKLSSSQTQPPFPALHM